MEPIAVTVEGGLKMAKQTNSMFDPTEPVPKIVEALHEAKIPIAALELVFEEVRKDIRAYTIPYSPSVDNTNALATSATTESAAEPKG